jgi:hypothetical protein
MDQHGDLKDVCETGVERTHAGHSIGEEGDSGEVGDHRGFRLLAVLVVGRLAGEGEGEGEGMSGRHRKGLRVVRMGTGDIGR